MELEFEITGTRAEANDWLDRAVNFLDEIETDKVSLKVELKEIVVPGNSEKEGK